MRRRSVPTGRKESDDVFADPCGNRAAQPTRPGSTTKARYEGWCAMTEQEWDVALSDGASYRVFLDRPTGGWFIDAILD